MTAGVGDWMVGSAGHSRTWPLPEKKNVVESHNGSDEDGVNLRNKKYKYSPSISVVFVCYDPSFL